MFLNISLFPFPLASPVSCQKGHLDFDNPSIFYSLDFWFTFTRAMPLQPVSNTILHIQYLDVESSRSNDKI